MKPIAGIYPDPIIDRSEEQNKLHVAKLRAELLELGYSVVKTEWLDRVMMGIAA